MFIGGGTPAPETPGAGRRPGADANPCRLLIAPAFLVLAALLYGLPPGLSPYRDSADMAAAGTTLGIAHPPGYPSYVLAAKAWTAALRLGEPAWRLNLLSAAAGAATASLAAWAALRAAGPLAATAAFLLIAGSPAWAVLSRVSEMYSLSALFGAALVAAWNRDEGTDGRRSACLAGLLMGLGLGMHQTLVLAAPACALVFGLKRNGRLPWAFLALGLAVHLFLPLRSAAEALINWGSAETFPGFVKMLTRHYYGGARLHPDRAAGIWQPGHWGAALVFSMRLLWDQWGSAGFFLAAAGLFSRNPLRLPLVLAASLTGPGFIVWADLDPAGPASTAILEPHLVLPTVFGGVLAGLGASRVREALAPRPGAVLLAGLLALQAARLGALTATGSRSDFSAEDLGKGMARSLERGGLLVDPDDQSAFTLAYLQAVRTVRTDLVQLVFFRTWWGFDRIKRAHPELLPGHEIRSGQDLLSGVVGKSFSDGRPAYVDFPGKSPPGAFPMPGVWGYRLLARTPPRAQALRLLRDRAGSLELDRLRGAPPGGDFFTRHAGSFRTAALSNLATLAQSLGEPALTERLHRLALGSDPELSESWNNLANALMVQGRGPEAVGCYRAALAGDPSPQIRYNLGRALVLSGREAEGRPELERASREGDIPDAANDLGLLELRAGRVHEAVLLWNGLLARHPEYALAYYNLGIAYKESGNLKAATEVNRRFAELTGKRTR